jgi:DNA-binding IclR family transcriptional regulator
VEKNPTPFEVRQRIIDVVSKYNRGVSSDYIASQLHLSDSDTERYLQSLEREQAIFRTPNGLWRMSWNELRDSSP